MKTGIRLGLVVALSLVAFIVGGAFLYQGQRNQTAVKAADLDTYTTDWAATSLLVLNRPGVISPDQIGLGVAGWSVTGSTASGKYFVEAWSLPVGFPTYNADGTNSNTDDTAWLSGVMRAMNISQYAYSFSTVAAGASVTNYQSNDGVVKVPGRTGSCGGTDNECVAATGAYGFEDWHDFTTATSGKVRAIGVLIPLKWHVSGKICSTSACTL